VAAGSMFSAGRLRSRLGSTCRLEFQVSRSPRHNEDMSEKQASAFTTTTAATPTKSRGS
jgi:hypothetical protein